MPEISHFWLYLVEVSRRRQRSTLHSHLPHYPPRTERFFAFFSVTLLAKAVPATPCHGHTLLPNLGEASCWPWSLRGRRLPFFPRGKTTPKPSPVPLQQMPRREE